MPDVRIDDIVRVVNQGEAPMTVKYNSRDYVLQPGKDTFIPAACAFNWFGDPRAGAGFQSLVNEEGVRFFVPDRPTEVRRLRIKYGANLTGDEASFEGVAIPNVDVFTPEGEQLSMVLDDPVGRDVLSANVSVRGDEEMRAQLARQQQQIERLLAQQGLEDDTEPDSEADIPSDDSPADGPTVKLA